MARKQMMGGEGSPIDMAQDATPGAPPEASPGDMAADAAQVGARPTAMGEPADAEPKHLIGGQNEAAPKNHRGKHHAPNHGGTHRGHEPSGQHRHHALNGGFGRG